MPTDFGQMRTTRLSETASCQARSYIEAIAEFSATAATPLEQLAKNAPSWSGVPAAALRTPHPGGIEGVDSRVQRTHDPQNIKKFMEGFHYDALPWGGWRDLARGAGCISTFYLVRSEEYPTTPSAQRQNLGS